MLSVSHRNGQGRYTSFLVTVLRRRYAGHAIAHQTTISLGNCALAGWSPCQLLLAFFLTAAIRHSHFLVFRVTV